MKKLLLSLIALLGVGTYAMADAFKVETVEVRQGKTGTLALVLDGSADRYYRGYQLDIKLPEGLEVSDSQIGEGVTATTGNYMLSTNYTEGIYRVIYSDFNGSELQSGVVAYLTITDNGEYSVGDVLEATISKINVTYQPSAEDFTSYSETFANFSFSINIVEDRFVFDENATLLPTYTNGDKGNVKMNRTIKAGEWSTIVLPFTLNAAKAKAAFGDDVELAQFDSFEVGYTDEEDVTPDYITINFKTYTLSARASMTGGKPYIIKTSQDVTAFSADDVTLVTAANNDTKSTEYGTNGTFVGTLVKDVVPENGLFISENKFWYSTGSTNIKAFRGWFELDEILDKETDFGVKLNLWVDGEATSINGISNATINNGAVYTLDGKQMGKSLSRLPKGIYIQNGKKVVK